MDKDLIKIIVNQVMNDIKQNGDDSYDYGIFDNMNDAILAADVAQKQLYNLSIQKRNKIVDAIREKILQKDNLELLSREAVEETGIGRYEDKIIKNRLAAEKTPGMEVLTTNAKSGEKGLMLEEYCPFGVIGAITPTTNPTETIINNSISMIVGGNCVVFSPHPRAKNLSVKLVKMINEAVESAGGPRNTVTMVREPSMENTKIMMSHEKVRLLVATGGPSLVRSVLSSGKKAIGAGAGNPPVVVDETADVKKAAKDIVCGASFDNNVPCIAEKEVFAVESIVNELIYYMKENGAYELTDYDLIEKLDKAVSREDGRPNPKFVGKSAKELLKLIDVEVSDDIRLIIFRAEKSHHLVVEEMMMPILPVVSVSDVHTAIQWAYEAEHGNRHTAMMHSKNVDNLTEMARKLETTIFVKNAPSYAGIGADSEGCTTFTIAGPTGEGITNAKSFCRIRRCVLSENFNIR